jgi:hypothetical protein
MKLGSAAVLVVALAVPGLLSLGLSSGCGATSRPPAEPIIEPDEHPPLPPAAGTPIGFLVDDAGELKLSDDQLGKLRTINEELATQLASDDGEMRPEPVAPKKDDGKGRGLGFHAGGSQQGYGGMQAGTPPGQLPPGTGASTDPQGDGQREYVIPAATVNHVYQMRARHVRAAIDRALKLLDGGQQVIAKRVLVDHGVNLDTGEVRGGDPGTQKLEDPKLGKPLPREP